MPFLGLRGPSCETRRKLERERPKSKLNTKQSEEKRTK
jgi:hypothetical protein